MKRLLLTAAALVLAATPAFADIGAHDWAGLHVGVLADVGMQTAHGPVNGDNVYYGNYYGTGDLPHFTSGAGANVGYNWQMGHIVLGADFDWSAMEGNAESCDDAGAYCYKSKLSDYATLRAKAGIAIDNGLFYVTGGLASINRKDNVCYYSSCASYTVYNYGSHGRSVGLALGAGFEFAVDDDISVSAEYLYINAPQKTVTVPYDTSYIATFSSTSSIARIGVNWYVH